MKYVINMQSITYMIHRHQQFMTTFRFKNLETKNDHCLIRRALYRNWRIVYMA